MENMFCNFHFMLFLWESIWNQNFTSTYSTVVAKTSNFYEYLALRVYLTGKLWKVDNFFFGAGEIRIHIAHEEYTKMLQRLYEALFTFKLVERYMKIKAHNMLQHDVQKLNFEMFVS